MFGLKSPALYAGYCPGSLLLLGQLYCFIQLFHLSVDSYNYV